VSSPHLTNRKAVGDGEGQVKVRPTVSITERERTDDSTGDDASMSPVT
jgi:hypothetical protein